MSDDEKFFTYGGLNLLYNDVEDILSRIKIDEVILVPFKINFNANRPFNTFLLMNDFTNILDFPHVNTGNANESEEFFLSTIYCYLYSILFSTSNTGFSNYNLEKFVSYIEFKGLYICENNVYVFIDLTKVEINNNLMSKNSIYWFALLDEIVNKKQICNIPISCEVTDLFLTNSEFIYFKNSKEEQIEIPTVVYTGTHEKNLEFEFIFGNSASDNSSILSSGFYFTDYNNAFRLGGWSLDYKDEFKYGKKVTEVENGKYSKGGITRYALFLGNNLIKMNYPNDTIDESEIKKERLNNTFSDADRMKTLDYTYEKMTLRISDHDGLWKQNYDSVYLGKLELDDGNFLKNTPMYVAKDYYSHTPLSYHYIDKTSLGSIFDENCNYRII
uniref:Uncharacterized protein n=1 Tax=viral metagenome TaxID=1070528 RepID=A0A6C0D9U8_9ZZZZ